MPKEPKKAAAKKPAPPSRSKRMGALKTKMAKRFGETVIFDQATEVEYPWSLRRPTGIISIDLALAGGFPAGAVSQVWGKFSSGKTMLGLMCMAQVQKNYGNDAVVVYSSHGYGLDMSQARAAGCQIALTAEEMQRMKRIVLAATGAEMTPEEEKGLLYQPGDFLVIETGEGEAAEEKPAEACAEAVLEVVGSGLAQVVFFDEAAGSIPTADRIKKALDGDKDIRLADQASFVGEFLRKLTPKIKLRRGGRPNETTVLVAVQRRVAIGATKYQKQSRQAGGTPLEHYKAMDLQLTPIKTLRRGKEGPIYGKEIKWSLDKGKLHTHEGHTGVVPIVWDRDGLVDHSDDTGEVGASLGMFKKKKGSDDENKATYSIIARGEVLAENIEGGLPGVKDFLRMNGVVMRRVREEILATIGSPVRFT